MTVMRMDGLVQPASRSPTYPRVPLLPPPPPACVLASPPELKEVIDAGRTKALRLASCPAYLMCNYHDGKMGTFLPTTQLMRTFLHGSKERKLKRTFLCWLGMPLLTDGQIKRALETLVEFIFEAHGWNPALMRRDGEAGDGATDRYTSRADGWQPRAVVFPALPASLRGHVDVLALPIVSATPALNTLPWPTLTPLPATPVLGMLKSSSQRGCIEVAEVAPHLTRLERRQQRRPPPQQMEMPSRRRSPFKTRYGALVSALVSARADDTLFRHDAEAEAPDTPDLMRDPMRDTMCDTDSQATVPASPWSVAMDTDDSGGVDTSFGISCECSEPTADQLLTEFRMIANVLNFGDSSNDVPTCVCILEGGGACTRRCFQV